MSITGLNYWNPVLQVDVLRGFPAQLLPILRDRITSFELEDDARLNDKVSMVLNNADGLLLDVQALALGAVFNLSFGYPGAMTTPRLMHCKKIAGGARIGSGARSAATNPHTAAGGIVAMELRSEIWGMDLFRAQRTVGGGPTRQLTFEKMTIPEMVQQIARQYGYDGAGLLVAGLDGEPVHETYTIPAKMSDAEWVQDQAKRRRWVFSIDADGFHFHPPHARASDPQGVEELSWFNGDPDVIDWSVSADLRVPQAAEIVGLNDEANVTIQKGAELQEDVSSTEPFGQSEPGVPAVMSSSAPLVVQRPGQRKLIAVDRLLSTPNPTRRQIEKAEAMIQRSINRWTLELNLVGNPRAHARKPVNLTNFGPYVDGAWWVKKAVHTIRPGSVYRTRLECARKSPGGDIKAYVTLQAGGQVQQGESQNSVPGPPMSPFVSVRGN